MEDREAKLGFKPQKEVPYNALLPYSDHLDTESNDQLAHIKAGLARAVQLRDIKIGLSHWTGQLSKSVSLVSSHSCICYHISLSFELRYQFFVAIFNCHAVTARRFSFSAWKKFWFTAYR